MGVLRPIGHADQLSIVDHLDELRSRLIWCLVAFVAAFSVCYWQNEKLLEIVNAPLEESQQPGKGNDPLEQAARYDAAVGDALERLAPALAGTRSTLDALAAEPGVGAAARAQAQRTGEQLQAAAREVARAARVVPDESGRRPVTLGVAEPFVVTFTVAGYAALLLSLPFILWQAYAFMLPAFDRRERRVAVPLMAMVPVLFVLGVAFGYEVALPRAVDFLQNFNDDAFDILIGARDYYRFVVLFLAMMGLVFQVPVGVLALTRTGVVNARVLWKNQGYVILAISVVAAVVTPTPDPFTMLITMAPLVLLYELSIGLAWLFRPRGDTVAGRWGEWWESDEQEPDDEPPAEADGAADAGDRPARVS
jgi:sec-independent protein translocase protein TatC